MVQSLMAELGNISQILPTIVRAIIVTIACMVAWVVLSVPAYWISKAISVPLQNLAVVLENVRAKLASISNLVFATRKAPVERFISQHSQMFSFADENDAVLARLIETHSTVVGIPNRVAEIEQAINTTNKSIKESGQVIQRIQWPKEVEVPEPKHYVQVRMERNDAWLRAFTFGFFALFLISINTAMLKEFFGSFIPPLKFFGVVPLPVIIAFLFSVIEMLFGASLAFIEGTSSSSFVGRVILCILIAVLGVIEMGFYAQFGIEYNFNPFAMFWEPDSPPAWSRSWFGIFGPLVVVGMAWAGHGLFVAARSLVRDHVVRQYRDYLDSRTKSADEINSKIEKAKSLSSEFVTLVKGIQSGSGSAETLLGKSAEKLVAAKIDLAESLDRARQLRLDPFKTIGDAEMERTYYNGLFFLLSACVAYLIIAASFGAFGFNYPIVFGNVRLPGLAVAVGEAAFLIGAGMTTARAMSQIPSGDVIPIGATRAMAISVWASYAVVISVITANGVAFLSRGSVLDFLWFAVSCASCFWLFVVGRRLGLTLASVWAFIQSVSVVVSSACAYIAAGVVLICKATVVAFLGVLKILEYPYWVVFKRNKEQPSDITQSMKSTEKATIATMALISILIGSTAWAQQAEKSKSGTIQTVKPSVDPQSSISVLIDLSSTWHTPSSKQENVRILKEISKGISALVSDIDPPVVIRYLPIGDLSLGQKALCEVIFTPTIFNNQSGQNSKEVNTLQKLEGYLGGVCIDYVLSRKQERLTDITGAFDGASRSMEAQIGKYKAIIALSDFKEELRKEQKSIKLRLSGVKTLLVYRILPEDRMNPNLLDGRIGFWREKLTSAGAKVTAHSDQSILSGQIGRVLMQ